MRKYRSVFRIILLSALVTCTGIANEAAASPPAYHVTDLGTLGGTSSTGWGINASGQVTGLSATGASADHAFLYDGAMHDLGTLGGTVTVGQSISDGGQVTGYSLTTGDAEYHAFLYDGTIHDLGTLGGTSSYGHGINSSGQVTGYSTLLGGLYYETRAFIWTEGSGMQDLGTLGGAGSQGSDINANGHVTGGSDTTDGEFHAILFDGTMHDLGTLGGSVSYGYGINYNGLVTGMSYPSDGDELHAHAFVWTPTMRNGASGAMQDLGTLGGTYSRGTGINASGQVTGISTLTAIENYVYHPFLYTSDSGMLDLNSLINPHLGWNLEFASDINDAGQITGYGRRFGEADHALLLTPVVPEPSSLALSCIGAAALAIRRIRRTTILLCLFCALSVTTAAAATPPAYTVTDLGTLGGTSSTGQGINASGQVAGESDGHAFLFDGTMIDLGTLGGTPSYGLGINDSGQVTGDSYTTGNVDRHAFVYDGTLNDLGTLGGTYSSGSGINASGQVAGVSTTSGISPNHAFLWTPTTPGGASGTMHDLGTLGGTDSYGSGINDSGQVAGDSYTTGGLLHAFLWTPTTPGGDSGAMHDLGTLGGTWSFGSGINASGQVSGDSYTTGNAAVHAFLHDGAMHDLGTLGGTNSAGFGINASGQVTGYSYTNGDAAQHTFLYTSGSGMVDLNSLIDPLSGWELYEGRGINDVGQITGTGFIGGRYHAFLLTPVPEPSTLALVVLGTAAFAVRRTRRTTNLLCLFCALFVTTAAAATPPAYHVTDLGTLGGPTSYGVGINASGQVSGLAYITGDPSNHAFLWTPTTPNGASGTMTDLGTLGGTISVGSNINADGQVTGYSYTTGDFVYHAFLYDGTLHDLGTLGGTNSGGSGINASGQVTGNSSATGDTETHAFLWTPTTPNGDSGTLHDLGTLGGTYSTGSGINAGGQVTGWSFTTDGGPHAFLWTPTTPNGDSGTMHDLGTLGGTYSYGSGINDSGQVAGLFFTTGDAAFHAFLYDGTLHDLGTLGGSLSTAYGINDSGQVTGGAFTAGGNQHAFLYTTGPMVDLNSLIDPLSGWELYQGSAINDAGQITGWGYIGGQQHAFLLTPVPEPTAFVLAAVGSVCLLLRVPRPGGVARLPKPMHQ